VSVRFQVAVGTGLATLALALLAVALRTDHPVRAAEADDANYASPLEVLLSRDGARLYVLCQQSEEVRVLDARLFFIV
jgi:DNA-binding beta-propeller fold protein YncE